MHGGGAAAAAAAAVSRVLLIWAALAVHALTVPSSRSATARRDQTRPAAAVEWPSGAEACSRPSD